MSRGSALTHLDVNSGTTLKLLEFLGTGWKLFCVGGAGGMADVCSGFILVAVKIRDGK